MPRISTNRRCASWKRPCKPEYAVRVGYIGLGDIGASMAERILHGQHQLAVWNRTASKMTPLVAAGAIGATSPCELAQRSDIVCLCVDSANAVERVLFDSDGVAHARSKPRLVVDHSTIHPDKSISIASRLRESGIAMIDAPVSGGAIGARAGVLAVMVGGEAADVMAARPVISCYAGRITHMGPIGSGQATKACNQIINFGTLASIAEAVALGAAFGLDIQRLPEALAGGFADSNMLREYARGAAGGERPYMTYMINWLVGLFRGELEPAAAGRMAMALKDLGIVSDLARTRGTSAAITGLVESLFRTLNNQNAGQSVDTKPP
jgi:3-hydroxyisobutyrate dehydrogenase